MVFSSPVKILVGLPFDLDQSKQLLSWAITDLARQNDCIVATHIIVSENLKKRGSMPMKTRLQLRQAKAFVISILGEFAGTSQCKHVNLEARVGFNSSIGRGLVEEAKSISADFLVLCSTGNRFLNRFRASNITRYCFEHSPQKCSLIFLGKHALLQPSLNSDSVQSKESQMPVIKNLTVSKPEKGRASPRAVLDDQLEGASISESTEDETESSGASSFIESPQPPARQFNDRLSPRKLISSFLGSLFKKRNCSFSNKHTPQPLLKCFTHEEIAKATNNFHTENMVGQGGYSEVYRGELSDGKAIAVKCLAQDNKDAIKEKEFLMELGIIGHVFHPNTASLVGCCIENGLYLIFNLSQNGNLSSALHDKTGNILEWSDRYKIAVGIARGLHYLHKCCKHRIIHRDIKASNVLLGPDYEPQITDFGLAKWLPNKWTHHAVIPIEGTFGYLAPEYFMHGIVDEKTDVFAFGVLLLEIVAGKRPVDSSKKSLLLWAKPWMEAGEMEKLVDERMKGRYEVEELQRVVMAASYCVRESSVERPSMSQVLEVLTKGHDSEIAKSCKIPKLTADDHQLDDYSMIFGYQVPIDTLLEEYL